MNSYQYFSIHTFLASEVYTFPVSKVSSYIFMYQDFSSTNIFQISKLSIVLKTYWYVEKYCYFKGIDILKVQMLGKYQYFEGIDTRKVLILLILETCWYFWYLHKTCWFFYIICNPLTLWHLEHIDNFDTWVVLILLPLETHRCVDTFNTWNVLTLSILLKLAIHLSFLAFRHVRALFHELFREIANQLLDTSHNIANFVHLWFCEKLDEKFFLSPLWRFVKISAIWWEWRNGRREK